MLLYNGLMKTAILGRNLSPDNKLKRSVLCVNMSTYIEQMYRQWPGNVQDDTKKRNFRKTQQKLKKSQKKKLLTEIEPLKLAF